MINYNIPRLFRSREFNQAFHDLFSDSGPMTYIIRNYPLMPAKGGTKWPIYKDTTYLVHVINTAYIGGLILENKLKERNVKLDNYREYIKLFFASAILHDFNKLVPDNIWMPRDYLELLNNKKQAILKIYSPYIRDDENIFKEIEYIILNVENQSKDIVNNFNIEDDKKKILILLADTISDGDKISSKMSLELDDFSIGHTILNDLKNNGMINVSIIEFQPAHQSLLRNYIIRYTCDYFKEDAIIKSPNWIILNREIGNEEKIKLKAYLIGKLKPLTSDYNKIATNYRPSSNQINTTFADEINVTPEFLTVFMNLWGSALLLYQKLDRLNQAFHISDMFKLWGFDVSKDGKIKYIEDNDNAIDEDISLKSAYVKTAILRRIELDKGTGINIEDEIQLLQDSGIDVKAIDAITFKTIISAAYSYINKEHIKSTFQETITRVSAMLNRNAIKRDDSSVYSSLIDRILSDEIVINKDIRGKEENCIQCREYFNNMNLTRINSFGINATSGTGLKVSVLEYSDMYNGKICSLCNLENKIRTENYSKTSTLCVQTYIGDYIPFIDIGDILQNYENLRIANNSEESYKDVSQSYLIRLSNNLSIPIINYHNITFLDIGDKDSRKNNDPRKNIISQFYFLRNLIKIISETGIKLKISTMFESEDTFYYTFKWESAPSWVRDYGLDELRIDQIIYAQYFLDMLGKLAQLDRGYRDIPSVISKLEQQKMNIYQIIWNSVTKKPSLMFRIGEIMSSIKQFEVVNIEEKERRGMEELVDISLPIDKYAKMSSNSDYSWIIRTAFTVYERNRRDKKGKINNDKLDIEQKIAGILSETANRRNDQPSKEVQEACLNFAHKFMEIIENTYNGMPSQSIKRDIIAQFALLYNIAKWNKIKEYASRKNNEVKE